MFLREEEIVYATAYKETVIDEERLLKHKAKIQWLREGDANSSYFHDMIKGRVSKNRISEIKDKQGNSFQGNNVVACFVTHFEEFFKEDNAIYPIDDPDSLFSKKLDAETAMGLIGDVTDVEIKTALFDIDDDKASGPDGYTSKFFKAA